MQGAESQVRGRYRGYCGLRRPPRVAFKPKAQGLQALDQTFFWPMWLLRINSVSCPSLWQERSVLSLVIAPRQGRSTIQNEIRISRSHGFDHWSAQDDMHVAVGRVGMLRGPLAICVDAILDTNLELSKPSRVTVGTASIDPQTLHTALASSNLQSLTLKVKPSPNIELSLGEGDLGHLELEIGPGLDPKILPERFIPDKVDGAEEDEKEEDAGKLILHKLGPSRLSPADIVTQDIEMTEKVLKME